MRGSGQFGRSRAAFNRVGDRGDPVSDIQGGSLAGQNVIAQRPQHDRQIAEPLFGRGVLLALAMLANPRNQPISGGALRVEVFKGEAERDRRDQSWEGFGEAAGGKGGG